MSTINNESPILIWVYADRETPELKDGKRTQSNVYIIGSWGRIPGAKGALEGLMLDGEEAAVAIRTLKTLGKSGGGITIGRSASQARKQ